MKITDILEIPFVWRLFRKMLDIFFGVYRNRQSIIREFGITNQMSIVDIACGSGQYSLITNGQYLGIDISNKYIETARKLYGSEKRKFVCADVNTYDFSLGSYDAAFMIDVTHHLSDQENKILFKTLDRSSTRSIVICDPVIQSKNNLIGRFFTSLDRGGHQRYPIIVESYFGNI